MSFDWKNYYTLAVELMEVGTEAAFRSSISKVYYSLFNILCIQAGYNTKSTKAELSHKNFIEEFKALSDVILDSFPDVAEDELVHIGSELNHLRRDAEDACYIVEQIFELLEEEE